MNSPEKLRDFQGLSEKQILLAMAMNFVFMVVEFVAGVFSNSLVLITDSVHDFLDILALGIAWVASRKAQAPADAKNTFGFARATVLSAIITSGILVVITVFIFLRAIDRIFHPQPVEAGIVLAVSVVGLIVNAFVASKILAGRNRHDLNMKSVFLHVAEDMLSWLAAIVSALVIIFTGFTLIDPILSFVIGLIILFSAVGVLRESFGVLMESVPKSLDHEKITKALEGIEGIIRVHDLHVWSISSGFFVLSCHIGVKNIPVAEAQKISLAAKKLLAQKFGISHCTIELECVDCEIIGGELVCKF